MTEPLYRPKSPDSADLEKARGDIRPEEWNPDLMAASMARQLISRMPKPSIVSKKFAVHRGMFAGINHVQGTNETYFDSSLIVRIYDAVADDSVNIDGKLFNSEWAYLMKPNYIIQGMPLQQGAIGEEQPGFVGRMLGRLTGRGGNEQEQKK